MIFSHIMGFLVNVNGVKNELPSFVRWEHCKCFNICNWHGCFDVTYLNFTLMRIAYPFHLSFCLKLSSLMKNWDCIRIHCFPGCSKIIEWAYYSLSYILVFIVLHRSLRSLQQRKEKITYCVKVKYSSSGKDNEDFHQDLAKTSGRKWWHWNPCEILTLFPLKVHIRQDSKSQLKGDYVKMVETYTVFASDQHDILQRTKKDFNFQQHV